MLQFILGAVSFFAGSAATIQSAVNGKLRAITKNPIFASFASFAGGVIMLFVMLMGAHIIGIYTIPTIEMLSDIRPWMFIGGIFGTALVVGSIIIPKKIGFAPYFSLLVSGQLIGSVIADAIGFLGNEVHLPSPLRIVGIALLIAGASLIQKKNS